MRSVFIFFFSAKLIKKLNIAEKALNQGEFMRVLILLLLVSCAHKKKTVEKPFVPYYIVEVDSISASKAAGKTFSIVSGDKSIASNDLRFRAYAEQAANVLKADGFAQSTKPKIKIILTYGIGEPVSYTETRSVPVYGSTTSQVSNSWGQNLGRIQTFGQTGTRVTSGNRTEYKRTVVLKAVSAKTGEPLWETVLTSSGNNDNLSEVFPYMLMAGAKHYGTSAKAEYKIDEDNAVVKSFRP